MRGYALRELVELGIAAVAKSLMSSLDAEGGDPAEWCDRVAREIRSSEMGEHRLLLLDALAVVGESYEERGRPEMVGVVFQLLAGLAADSDGVDFRLRGANATLRVGIAFAAMAMASEAVDSFMTLERNYGIDRDPRIRNETAIGLQRCGNQLVRLGRDADALAAFDLALKRIDVDNSQQEPLAVAALHGRVRVLGRLGRDADVADAAASLVELRGHAIEPEARALLLDALIEASGVLIRAKNWDASTTVLDAVISEASLAATPAERGRAVLAVYDKAAVLRASGHASEAEALFTDFAQRRGYDGVAYLDDAVTSAGEACPDLRCAVLAYQKSYLLATMGQDCEALITLDLLIARFADVDVDGVAEVVRAAKTLRSELGGF